MTSPLFGVLEQSGLEPAAFGGRSVPAVAATPPVPTPPPPVPLPDPEDPAVLAARRMALTRAVVGRAGRAATTLRTQEDYSTDRTGVA
jgi:hypothetical protein